MLLRACLLFSIAFAGAAGAADFDVQIGAFRNPDVSSLEVPAGVGELRTVASQDGLTRFLVGPFQSRAAAERARDALRAAGYAGAFVRVAQGGQVAAADAKPAPRVRREAPAQADGEAFPPPADLELLSSLSAEERRNVVYLDGRLHRKIGDRFIPLRD